MQNIPPVGLAVSHAFHPEISYTVTAAPNGDAYSIDNTVSPPVPFVWLVVTEDMGQPASRQRIRSARPEHLTPIVPQI